MSLLYFPKLGSRAAFVNGFCAHTSNRKNEGFEKSPAEPKENEKFTKKGGDCGEKF